MADNKIEIGQDNSGNAINGDNNTIHQNKNYFFKASNLAIVGVGLLVVIGLTQVVSNGGINRSFNNIHDSNITVGISDTTYQKMIAPYEQIISDLKAKLEKAPSSDEQLELYRLLNIAKKELAKKTQEIQTLQQTIKTYQPNDTILIKMKQILDTKGTTEAINYLQGIEVQKEQERIDKSNQKLAKIFQTKAQLLIIENRYKEAKTAYAQMTHYDRSFDALFEYALFLQKQNYFEEAIQGYQNLLDLKLSQADRASVLNNLALLYQSQNQNQEALQAYQEALKLRRELAKANPNAYEIVYAQMLIMGVDLFRQDKKDLQEAKKILEQERYKDVYQAQKFLQFIESL